MSKIVKAAFAVALAAPMVLAGGVANATDFPAENDCNRPFGAITTHPGANAGAYGIDNGPADTDDAYDCDGDTGGFERDGGQLPRS